jgi:hypothetical protein
MKIIIRLVGYSEIINDEKYVYELEYIVNTIFNFEILKMIFNKYDDIISANELNNCTLTGDSKNLKKDYLINDTTKKVFIFTGNTEIKNKLVHIFKTNGYKLLVNDINTNTNTNNNNIDTNNNNNIEIDTDIDTDNDIDIDTDNDIDKKIFNLLQYTDYDNENTDYDNENTDYDNENTDYNNNDNNENTDNIIQNSDVESNNGNNYEDTEPIYIKQNLDLLKDNDFITLLRIYKTRGDLFNDFYKYINSSQIIKFNKLENNIDYNENLNLIKELNLDFKENDIIEALKKTGNHVNLSIRYLLYNN